MSCDLLAGPFAWFVQTLAFLAGVITVIYQWYTEENRRKPWVFLKDASSLAVGCVVAHFINLIILEQLVRNDRCAWYMLYYFIDFCVVTSLSLWIYKHIHLWIISVLLTKTIFVTLFYYALPWLIPVQGFIHRKLLRFQSLELFIAGFFLPVILNTAQLLLSGKAMQQQYTRKNAN